MKNMSKLYMGLLLGLVVSSAAFAALPVAAACGVADPSFDSPTIPHCGEKIKALAALAGPDWRAVAEKNRKPELKHLTKAKIIALMFHVFGMLWEPDGYTFFIDGKQHGPKVGQGEGEAVSQVEEFVLLTTEAKWYRNNRMTGKGVPELEAAAAAGDDFVVDYVRVYDLD